MQVSELLGRDLDTIKRTVRCIAHELKGRDPVAYNTFLSRTVQIGLFFYSDQFTIGTLTFEMLKDGYDEKYHTFAVRHAAQGVPFYRQTFQKVRPALNNFVDKYIAVYGNG